MKLDLFYSQGNRHLNNLVSRAVDMSDADAAKLVTGLEDDRPIVIRCGGREIEWHSRYLAYRFYYIGAISCEGSESDRYWKIAGDLLVGNEKPTDEEDYLSVG